MIGEPVLIVTVCLRDLQVFAVEKSCVQVGIGDSGSLVFVYPGLNILYLRYVLAIIELVHLLYEGEHFGISFGNALPQPVHLITGVHIVVPPRLWRQIQLFLSFLLLILFDHSLRRLALV